MIQITRKIKITRTISTFSKKDDQLENRDLIFIF